MELKQKNDSETNLFRLSGTLSVNMDTRQESTGTKNTFNG